MINHLTESQTIKIWRHQLLDRTELETEDGELIKVIYPGRANDDRGADFRDAVIATSRGLMKGDIEVHVKSSDWRAHRHHRDLSYNRVILHVVMWHDTEGATDLQNGGNVPIVALNKYMKRSIGQWSDGVYTPVIMPCLEAEQGITAEFLDIAGEERFSAKAARFQADSAEIEASQSLYQGIMEALGYSKNKLPMLRLAQRLPLQILESVARGEVSGEECLARQQALLLGTAGLLPSQRRNCHQRDRPNDGWADKLERLWASSPHSEAMSESDWHLFKVRPNNFPVRRLAAMSCLIVRFRGKGLLEQVVNMIRKAPLRQGHHQLEEALVVGASGYWASHLDFDLSSRARSPTLLGSRRAADIVVNVLLPFTLAWSRHTSQPELGRRAFDLYCGYPKLAANTVDRHMMNQLGPNSSLVNSARRQQGLIHIYNTLCTQGGCNSCRLGQFETGDYIQI